jgi:hypothetical protein
LSLPVFSSLEEQFFPCIAINASLMLARRKVTAKEMSEGYLRLFVMGGNQPVINLYLYKRGRVIGTQLLIAKMAIWCADCRSGEGSHHEGRLAAGGSAAFHPGTG